LGDLLNGQLNTPRTGSVQTLSSLELLNILNQFADGELQYMPDAKAVRDDAELEKVEQIILERKEALYNLGEKLKRRKRELKRLSLDPSSVGSKVSDVVTSSAFQEPIMVPRVAELEGEVVQLTTTVAALKEAAAKSEADANARVNELNAQLMAVNQNQVKMRALCDTLKRQKKDAEAKYQALEEQIKADLEAHGASLPPEASAVVDVESAVAAAVSAALADAQQEFATRLAEYENSVAQLRTTLEGEAEARVREEVDNIKVVMQVQALRTQVVNTQRARELEVNQAESDRTIEKYATRSEKLDAELAECRAQLAALGNWKAACAGATQHVANLQQQLSAAPSAEAFAAQNKEVKELRDRQSVRAGLVSAAVAKLRALFPANIGALARKAGAQNPDLPGDKLDHYLLGSFGQVALEKLVLDADLSAAASTQPPPRSGAPLVREVSKTAEARFLHDQPAPAGLGNTTPEPLPESHAAPQSRTVLGKRARGKKSSDRVGCQREDPCAVRITGFAPYTSKNFVRALASSVAPPDDLVQFQVTPSGKVYLIHYKTSSSARLAVERFHGMYITRLPSTTGEKRQINVHLYDPANETARTVFVKNLGPHLDDVTVEELLRECGSLVSMKAHSGGFLAVFCHVKSAQKAQQELDGVCLLMQSELGLPDVECEFICKWYGSGEPAGQGGCSDAPEEDILPAEQDNSPPLTPQHLRLGRSPDAAPDSPISGEDDVGGDVDNNQE
jgi:hypothetical protein